MNPRTYDRVMNMCLVVAVVSALLWGHLGHLNQLAGVAGIGSGLVALFAYFFNSMRLEAPRKNAGGESVAFTLFAPARAMENDLAVLVRTGIQAMNSKKMIPATGFVLEEEFITRRFHKQMCKWATREVIAQCKMASSTPQTGYDFVLSPDGEFTIRPITGHKWDLPEDSKLLASANCGVN
jgi:hypothetical protein